MKKLLVVCGAGASMEFGFPSVHKIDSLLEQWAISIAPLGSNSSKSLYSWVKEKFFAYVSQNNKNRTEAIINFENLLYTIQSIYSIGIDLSLENHQHRLNPFIKLKAFPKIISFGINQIAKPEDFHNLHSILVDNLLKHFRGKCNTLVIENGAEIKELRGFFSSLKQNFQLGFINLNYDNVILSALPNLNTGFDKSTGEFNRKYLYNKDWNFCYHLHGSVHFDMRGGINTEMHKIFWNENLSSKFAQNSSGRNSNFTSEGIDHLNSSIITGLDKSNQILREPFNSYFMQLDRLVFEADAILFMGYGFNDIHLNKVFPFIRFDQVKQRKVVVIDYANIDQESLQVRRDSWSFGLGMAIPYNMEEMGNGRNMIPEHINYFKQNNVLEKSYNPKYPLAIWYNGVLQACKYPDKIISELL